MQSLRSNAGLCAILLSIVAYTVMLLAGFGYGPSSSIWRAAGLVLLLIPITVFGAYVFFANELAKPENAKLKKRWQKGLSYLVNPESKSKSLKTVTYNIPHSDLAAQILKTWLPESEKELIEGAPIPVCGMVTKAINPASGKGYVSIEALYDVAFPGTDIAFVTRTGKLYFNLSGGPLAGQTTIEYEWNGPELALTDIFSIDYKVLHYLIKRAEDEFLSHGYKVIASSSNPAAAQQKNATGRHAKQWWRTYEGAPGEKTYAYWPNPQEYAEAVQNPQTNFKDEGLQKCTPALNAIGMPKVASGMFASVYQLMNAEEEWAVRCFDKRLIDQQERYKAISNFITSDDLTYTVDFHYLEDGIKCGSTWFPILKMTWVEGQSLDAYVRDNHKNPSVLEKLRWDFQTMMEKLRTNGVAHGDLQHGNILVSNGQIFLVDYDGFYVPELAGKHSNELGHANYQHPTRTEKYFAPYIDNFSALVIDLSLLCLMEDQSLWLRFNGGDECLLFRKADYVQPDSSRLIATLKTHKSERLRNGVQKLLNYLQTPLEELPYLDSDRPETIPTVEILREPQYD